MPKKLLLSTNTPAQQQSQLMNMENLGNFQTISYDVLLNYIYPYLSWQDATHFSATNRFFYKLKQQHLDQRAIVNFIHAALHAEADVPRAVAIAMPLLLKQTASNELLAPWQQFCLGVAYAKGWLVEIHIEKALLLLFKAYQGGYIAAARQIANIYKKITATQEEPTIKNHKQISYTWRYQECVYHDKKNTGEYELIEVLFEQAVDFTLLKAQDPLALQPTISFLETNYKEHLQNPEHQSIYLSLMWHYLAFTLNDITALPEIIVHLLKICKFLIDPKLNIVTFNEFKELLLKANLIIADSHNMIFDRVYALQKATDNQSKLILGDIYWLFRKTRLSAINLYETVFPNKGWTAYCSRYKGGIRLSIQQAEAVFKIAEYCSHLFNYNRDTHLCSDKVSNYLCAAVLNGCYSGLFLFEHYPWNLYFSTVWMIDEPKEFYIRLASFCSHYHMNKIYDIAISKKFKLFHENDTARDRLYFSIHIDRLNYGKNILKELTENPKYFIMKYCLFKDLYTLQSLISELSPSFLKLANRRKHANDAFVDPGEFLYKGMLLTKILYSLSKNGFYYASLTLAIHLLNYSFETHQSLSNITDKQPIDYIKLAFRQGLDINKFQEYIFTFSKIEYQEKINLPLLEKFTRLITSYNKNYLELMKPYIDIPTYNCILTEATENDDGTAKIKNYCRIS